MVVRLVKWTSPMETRAFVELVMQAARLLGVQEVESFMEPTGTYGDPLRALLLAHGAQVFMLSPKRVHDAVEVASGVPSTHDAKACVVIARLHHQGVSTPYIEPSPLRVRLRALVEQRELYRLADVVMDSGVESLNGAVNELFDTTALRRVIAQIAGQPGDREEARRVLRDRAQSDDAAQRVSRPDARRDVLWAWRPCAGRARCASTRCATTTYDAQPSSGLLRVSTRRTRGRQPCRSIGAISAGCSCVTPAPECPASQLGRGGSCFPALQSRSAWTTRPG